MLVISADGTYVIEDDGTISSLGSSDLGAGDDPAGTAAPGRRRASGGPATEHPSGSAKGE